MSDKIRESFEHTMTHDFKCIVGSADPYPAGLERDWWMVWQKAWQAAIAKLPATVAVTEVIRVQACNLGRYGAAYDPASTHYAYSYSDQPDNVGAMKLGRAAATNAIKSHGDEIDRGLHLLQTLQAEGFGVFQIAAAPAAPIAVQMPVAFNAATCSVYDAQTAAKLAAPPAAEQPDTTTCDKYRAELYDEVWEKARDMGYGNVTEALVALERMKAGGDKP